MGFMSRKSSSEPTSSTDNNTPSTSDVGGQEDQNHDAPAIPKLKLTIDNPPINKTTLKARDIEEDGPSPGFMDDLKSKVFEPKSPLADSQNYLLNSSTKTKINPLPESPTSPDLEKSVTFRPGRRDSGFVPLS